MKLTITLTKQQKAALIAALQHEGTLVIDVPHDTIFAGEQEITPQSMTFSLVTNEDLDALGESMEEE